MAKPAPIILPDVLTVRQHPETLERLLVVGALKSLRFFRQLQHKVCPFLPKMGTHRQDFNNRLYNATWPIIESWWAKFARVPVHQDLAFPIAHFENYLVDRSKAGLLPEEDAITIKDLIQPELENLEFTPELYAGLVESEAFHDWLEGQVLRHEIRQLSLGVNLAQPTLADLQAAVDRAQQTLSPIHNNLVNARDTLLGKSVRSRMVDTGLPPLNKALGGGLMAPECVMIAAAQGGGKTVLASQLTWEIASQGIRVLEVTTEEPPELFIGRMASNVAKIPAEEMRVRPNLEYDEHGKAVVENIPLKFWDDPVRYDSLHNLGEVLHNYVYIADWSKGQGYSIVQNLEPEIEHLESIGWSPEVIIVDWIGGALSAVTSGAGDERNKKNRLYEDAANSFVSLCKRRHNVGLVFAQADMTKATWKVRAVTKNMLSESKTMLANFAWFVGISSLKDTEKENLLAIDQYFNPDKTRYGPGGLVPVKQKFQYQRFENPPLKINGGQVAN